VTLDAKMLLEYASQPQFNHRQVSPADLPTLMQVALADFAAPELDFVETQQTIVLKALAVNQASDSALWMLLHQAQVGIAVPILVTLSAQTINAALWPDIAVRQRISVPIQETAC
jgi:hypothetical protein